MSLAPPDRKKRKLKGRHSSSNARSLLPQRPGWTDNFLIFILVTYKCQSLVTVACFVPGPANDFSAPRYRKRSLQTHFEKANESKKKRKIEN